MLTWRADYADSSSLPQLDGDGTENSYHRIDRARLQRFVLLDGQREVYAVYLKPGQQLIFRRRHWLEGSAVTRTVYLVGWRARVGGQEVQAVNYLCPDGHVELDDCRADIELYPEER